MFRKVFFSIATVFFICQSIEGAATYTVLSIAPDQLTISVSFTGTTCESKQSFSFTTLPGTSFTTEFKTEEDGRIEVNSSICGWYGKQYLQWLTFTPCINNSPINRGSLIIKFSRPVIDPLQISRYTIKGNSLQFPTLSVLSKSSSLNFLEPPYKRGLRIPVDKDGIYEISVEKLLSTGIPVNSIPARSYRLFEKDREIPIYITNPQHTTLQNSDRILFYGNSLRGTNHFYSQFSYTNVYWLTWGDTIPGIRVADASGSQRKDALLYGDPKLIPPLALAKDFLDTVHVEYDNDIFWMGSIDAPEEMSGSFIEDTVDNWYWGAIGNQDSTKTSFSFDIPEPATKGSARIRIALMGLSSVDTLKPDHRFTLFLNDKQLSIEAAWDGKEPYLYECDIDLPYLQRHNTLEFKSNSSSINRVALNWIDLIYTRTFQVTKGHLQFNNDKSTINKVAQFTIKGFPDDSPIELWDLDKHRFITGFDFQHSTASNTYTLTFQDSANSITHYFTQQVSARLQPNSMQLDTIKQIWDTLSNTDYFIISIDRFKKILEPLAKVHSLKGLRTAFIDIHDIYNRFSYGIHDPESIRSFLKYVFSISGTKHPRFVLLGGDTSHDLDKRNNSLNIVPTHLTNIPKWGPGANDDYFVTVWGDDNIPDCAIGRFPARNAVDMQTLVDKTIKYLTKPDHGFWRDNLLMIGGGNSEEPEFTDNNTAMIQEVIGPKMSVSRIEAYPKSRYFMGNNPGSTNNFATRAISNSINSGVYAINFNGHGGGNTWSDNYLYSYDNLNSLYNSQWGSGSRLPMVFSFTCLTGFFESVSYRSLGEDFLRTSGNGCISFYGASAYTSKKGNLLLNRLLMEHAITDSAVSLGELLSYSELDMLARYGSQYLPLTRQYNLLGDPALIWKLTPDSLKLSLDRNALEGVDSLVVSASCAPVKKGQVRFVVSNFDNQWDQRISTVNEATVKETFAVKSGASASQGLVRAYAWNDSSDVKGWVPFSKDTIMVYDVVLSPEHPALGDSVLVSCKLNNPSSSTNPILNCRYAIGNQESSTLMYGNIRMLRDSSGVWNGTEKIYCSYKNVIGDRLNIFFQVVTSNMTKESSRISIPLIGLPDLTFTTDSIQLFFTNDSLAIRLSIVNSGSIKAPPVSLCILGETDTGIDTLKRLTLDRSLEPKEIYTWTFTMPDTQGVLRFTAVIDPEATIHEIAIDNNSIKGSSTIQYKDIKETTDTLSSWGGGLTISPSKQLEKSHRVFLFMSPCKELQPILTQSQWLPLKGDSLHSFTVFSRPSLTSTDSLRWTFSLDTSTQKNLARVKANALGKYSVMSYDSSFKAWRYSAGDNTSTVMISMHSSGHGPFAAAYITDLTQPDIQVSVNGREVAFLDYAAKDKPFSIFISDPSGVYPPSVKVLLNKNALTGTSISALPLSGDFKTISMTAYPKPEHQVDSLIILAEDFAGNNVSKALAFMPGEDLKIRFLSCHPNPFRASMNPDGSMQQIRFAYLLTDLAKEVHLTIFTVSGKPIMKWNFTNTIGYQEIVWDGRDSWGNRIGNGTYYAKLTASNERKNVKKIVRIAKLEGF